MSSNSNIFGMTGMTFNMNANGYDPYQTYSLPDTWTGSATKASSLSDPYSSLTYSSPGDYQSYNDWSKWQAADKTNRNQYNDNGYSLDTAKSFYTQPSNGDWATYQTALQTPGEVAAKQALDTGTKQVEDWATGNGLYGSSIMSNQYGTNVYNKYLDALTTNAANAASTRYQAEDASNQYLANLTNSIYGTRTTEWGNIDSRNLQEALAQNQYNQTQDSQKSTQQQALNDYNLKNSAAQNAFNTSKAAGDAQWDQWSLTNDNNLLKEAYNNTSAQTQFDAAQHQQEWQNYYNYWNNINPGVEENLANDTADKAASRESSSGLGGLLSGGLSVLGTIGGWGIGGGATLGGSLLSGLLGGSSALTGSGHSYGDLGAASLAASPGTYWGGLKD